MLFPIPTAPPQKKTQAKRPSPSLILLFLKPVASVLVTNNAGLHLNNITHPFHISIKYNVLLVL